MKPRHGAISTTLLTLAGALGLSAAGLSVVTGVTPCSLVGSCDTAAAPVATTVAGTCDSDAKTVKASAAEDCSSKTECAGETGLTLVSDTAAEGDCASKAACDTTATAVANASECATACSDEAKAVAVNASDCSGKTECDGEATAVAVNASSECSSSKSDCSGEAVAVNASDSACASECSGEAKAVAASGSDCSSKTMCDGDAEGLTLVNAADAGSDCATACSVAATTVAATDSDACGGECAEGDAVLPVAVNAFNDACPYSGNAAKADVVSNYNGMDVAFCCNGCKGRFEKADADTKLTLVAKVVTPIDDTCCNKPVKADTMAVVQGFPVAFCKDACGEMVVNATAEKQRAFVASHIKTINEDCCGTPAKEAKMVGFHHGKAVALCGEKCAEHFNAASAEKKDAWVAKMVNNSGKGECASECDDKAKGECGANCPHA